MASKPALRAVGANDPDVIAPPAPDFEIEVVMAKIG